MQIEPYAQVIARRMLTVDDSIFFERNPERDFRLRPVDRDLHPQISGAFLICRVKCEIFLRVFVPLSPELQKWLSGKPEPSEDTCQIAFIVGLQAASFENYGPNEAARRMVEKISAECSNGKAPR